MELNQVINTMYEGYVLKVVFNNEQLPSVASFLEKTPYCYTSVEPMPELSKVIVLVGSSFKVATVIECGTEELLDLGFQALYQPIVCRVDMVAYSQRMNEIDRLKMQFQKQMRSNLREKLLSQLKSALPETASVESIAEEAEHIAEELPGVYISEPYDMMGF